MAWYLKFPSDSGSEVNNKALIQLSGIATTGNVKVALTFAENVVDPITTSVKTAYLYDGRRQLNSIVGGAGGYFLESNQTIEQANTSNYQLNGSASTNTAWRTALAGSVYSFDTGTQPDGVISVGARFNEVASFWGLALRAITITDNNGTHTIDMSSSGGSSNEFTSTDGVVTLKLFNFSGTAHWVFYSSGATYQLTAQGGTFTYSGQTAALNRGFKLAAQGGIYSYAGAPAKLSYTTATIYRLDALGASYSYVGASASLLRGFVMDAQGGAYSYAGSDAVLRRGFKIAANGGAYSYAGADASLTYVAGPTVYRLTALGVTYVYSGANATLTATGVAPAANPNAFHITAQISGPQNISAMIGGTLTNNAKIGGNMTISARLSQ